MEIILLEGLYMGYVLHCKDKGKTLFVQIIYVKKTG